MPVHTNSIGVYQFIDIQGSVDPRAEQLEVIVRPGFDGVLARKTGSRGQPFTLRTVSYATNLAAALAATVALKALVGEEPQEVIKFSESWGDFLVLNVREVECRVMTNSTAGAYNVRMVHEWELLG